MTLSAKPWHGFLFEGKPAHRLYEKDHSSLRGRKNDKARDCKKIRDGKDLRAVLSLKMRSSNFYQ